MTSSKSKRKLHGNTNVNTKYLACCSVSNVKDKQGVVLSEKDQAERWVEHFKQVLNHPDADETDNIEPTKIPLDRDLDPPNVNEVRKSILTLKIGKAPKTKFIYYSLYGDVIRRQ